MSSVPRKQTPSHKQIATAQVELMRTLGKIDDEEKVELSAEELAKVCWGCLVPCERPEKAHIESFSKTGKTDPSQYFLLCSRCHRDQPDRLVRSIQLHWLKNRQHHFDFGSSTAIEMFAGLKSYALDHGVEDKIEEFAASMETPLAFKEMLRSLETGSGSSSRTNIKANIDLVLVQAFEEWLKQR